MFTSRFLYTFLSVILFCFLFQVKLLSDPTTPMAKVSGQIFTVEVTDTDTVKTSLKSASISLLAAKDSSVVTGAISDALGKFEIKTDFGEYLLKVSFVGYQTLFIPNILLKKGLESINLPEIILHSETLETEEVTVTAERPDMVASIDKYTFNIKKDLVKEGGDAKDVLRNLPSVTIEPDGAVKMLGKSPNILIDGKKPRMPLEAVPSEMVDQVELMHNPSARYAEEGADGVINIILKKDKDLGFNGYVSTAGTSSLDFKKRRSLRGSFNGNYKKRKFNVFARLSGNLSKDNNNSYSLYKNWRLFDTTSIENNTHNLSSDPSLNGSIGFDYDLTEKDLFSFTIFYYGHKSNNENNTSSLRRKNENIYEDIERSSNSKHSSGSSSSTLNYHKKFEEEGRNLWVDLMYSESKSPSNSFYTNIYNPISSEDELETIEARNVQNNSSNSFNIKCDYEHSFKGILNLETGANFHINKIYRKYDYDEKLNGEWNNIFPRSDNYDYFSQVGSMYINLKKQISSLGIKLGLRLAHTDFDYFQNAIDTSFSRKYWSVVPTLHLSYKISMTHSLNASYARYFSRPWQNRLNPRYILSSDSLSATVGNPDLAPNYTNSLRLGYMFFTATGTNLSASLGYSNTDGVVQSNINLIDGIVVSRPENIAKTERFNVYASFGQRLFSWWNVNLGGSYYKTLYEIPSTFTNKRVNSKSNGMSFNASTYINIDDFSFQIFGYYSSNSISIQSESKGFRSLSASCSYRLLNNRLSLSLSLNNIISSNIETTSYGDNFYSESNYEIMPRSISLSVSYKLTDKKEVHRMRRRISGSDDVKGSE